MSLQQAVQKTHKSVKDEWYTVSIDRVLKQKGSHFLTQYYRNSLSTALVKLYPGNASFEYSNLSKLTVHPMEEHDWLPWQFTYVPSGFWDVHKNQRKYFDWLADAINLRVLDDWYQVDSNTIQKYNGMSLVAKYERSLHKTLAKVYPEFQWHPWKFPVVSVRIWDSLDTQRDYFDWLGEQLGIRTHEEWYKVTLDDCRRYKGNSLLSLYQNSVIKALSHVYPEIQWQERSTAVLKNPGFWSIPSNQREFFDQIKSLLGVKEWQDWYKIKIADISRVGGWAILTNYYGGSLSRALQTLYPEHPWLPWNFMRAPTGFWNSPENQRKYFDWLAVELNIQKPEDWYKINGMELRHKDSNGILTLYDNSLVAALCAVYPEYNLLPWKFHSPPKKLWSKIENQRRYFDWFAAQMNITEPEGWYDVKLSQIYDNYGQTLIKEYYKGSLIKALMSVYPEYDWKFWKFSSVPVEYWQDTNQQQKFVEWVMQELDIKHPSDWNRITKDHLSKLGATGLFKVIGGFGQFLEKFSSAAANKVHHVHSSKAQEFLAHTARKAFPDVEMLIGYKHPKLLFGESKESMELDIFLPSYALAFEYQGKQHFEALGFYRNADLEQSKRDDEKKRVCESLGITLIQVPYWWDNTKLSLLATVHQFRPDIVKDPGKGKPIPEHPPVKKTRPRKKDNS